MFWRFEELPGEGDQGALVYDEVRQLLRNGDREWVQVPRHPAQILSLLLRVQSGWYTVSARALRAFLRLAVGKRVSGHVSELRKKIEECGIDAARVLESEDARSGYRLATGARAEPLSEEEARAWLGELLASEEKAAASAGGPRVERMQLREMLLLCSAFALALTGYLAFRGSGEEPIAHYAPEEGATAGTLVPHRACVELARELALRDQDVLAVELSRSGAKAPSRVVISVERERREDGANAVTFDLAPGEASTLRIPARSLDAGVRSHARRVCIGEHGFVESALQPGAIRLQAVRVE